jgi:hypothetical protein
MSSNHCLLKFAPELYQEIMKLEKSSITAGIVIGHLCFERLIEVSAKSRKWTALFRSYMLYSWHEVGREK